MPNKYYQEGVLAGMLAGGVQANVTNIGYQVTFKVDGNDYYVASCQQGESITEPPTPTSQTGIFTAWQINGVDVAFPYTPSADVELTAYFQNVRTEMEINEGNTPIIYKNGDVYASKKNDGRSIWATSSWSTGFSMVLIGFDSSAAETTGANPSESSTYSYNNVTYYYRGFNCSGTSYTHPTGVYEVGSASNFTTIVQRALDHYFYND